VQASAQEKEYINMEDLNKSRQKKGNNDDNNNNNNNNNNKN
jgi:hypothetical protein